MALILKIEKKGAINWQKEKQIFAFGFVGVVAAWNDA